jgi:hypothetical protein
MSPKSGHRQLLTPPSHLRYHLQLDAFGRRRERSTIAFRGPILVVVIILAAGGTSSLALGPFCLSLGRTWLSTSSFALSFRRVGWFIGLDVDLRGHVGGGSGRVQERKAGGQRLLVEGSIANQGEAVPCQVVDESVQLTFVLVELHRLQEIVSNCGWQADTTEILPT